MPPFRWVDEALARGNTLRQPTCVHRISAPSEWLTIERSAGSHILGIELADETFRLADPPCRPPSDHLAMRAKFPSMVRGDDGLWRLPANLRRSVPMLFSLQAVKTRDARSAEPEQD